MVLHTQYSTHYSIYCGLTDSIVPRVKNQTHDTSDCQRHSHTSPYGSRSWHLNHSVGHVHGTSIAVWDTFIAPQSPCPILSWHLSRRVKHVHTATLSSQLLMFMASQLPCQTRSWHGTSVAMLTCSWHWHLVLSNMFMASQFFQLNMFIAHRFCQTHSRHLVLQNMFMAPRPVKHVHGISTAVLKVFTAPRFCQTHS